MARIIAVPVTMCYLFLSFWGMYHTNVRKIKNAHLFKNIVCVCGCSARLSFYCRAVQIVSKIVYQIKCITVFTDSLFCLCPCECYVFK